MTVGTLVHLRFNPFGEPGKVVGNMRGKVVVEWRDLGLTGKHPPESLVVVFPAPTHGKNGTASSTFV